MNRSSSSAHRLLSASLVLVLVFSAGCASSKKTGETSTVPAPAATQDGRVYTNQVYVLVDGKEKGTVPSTVLVRRGMGARMVSLWQAGEEIRTYELQTVTTSDALSMTYSFFGEDTPTSTVYDVSTLPTAGKNNYVVPYSPYRITIEDRQYSLTLVVEE